MKKLIAFLSLPLLLAACASSTGGGSAAAPVTAAQTEQTLSSWHWMLNQATDANGKIIHTLFVRGHKPLQLDIRDGRFGISNACNIISGSLGVQGGQLHFGQALSTRRACIGPLMDVDNAILQRLSGTVDFALQTQPYARLTLTTTQGDVLVFTGRETNAMKYGSEGETIFLEVAAQTVPCTTGVMRDARCLQVRPVHFDEHGLRKGPPGEWQTFHQSIEGYTHEPGIRNVLRVRRYTIQNPPADGSSVAYVLDLVVESAIGN